MDKNIFQSYENELSIRVDDSVYKISKTTVSGIELRELASLDMDTAMWEAIPGADNDKLIGRNDIIELKTGSEFYTAKKKISPSR
jgi:hypothetical protein